MMSKKEGPNGLSSLLGTGVECEGTAKVDGTLRLDGTFRGNLEVADTLIIGQSGSFSGTACGREVVIAGRFKGEVLGTEQVELQKGARLEGDVLTRSFIIEPGVFFEGSCKMDFTDADEARLRVGSAVVKAGEKVEKFEKRKVVEEAADGRQARPQVSEITPGGAPRL